MPVRRRSCLAVAAMLLALAPHPAHAWDDVGHMVIVRIAWGQLTPAVRARLIALLEQAPPDAGLAQLRPAVDDPARDWLFAGYASTWPDLVRRNEPAARHAYHRGPWHYINWFWSEAPDGSPVPVTTLQPEPVNIVTELLHESMIVADTAASGADRAIAIAWVMHLVGDLHQPLHTSGRVTEQEPAGDKGGNTFSLGGSMSLHWYWDRVLTERYPREPSETEAAYIARVALAIEARTPPDSVGPRIGDPEFEHWARETLHLAERDVYCCGVQRGGRAPESYLAHVDAIAEPAIALAGYRLAALLNRLLATE